MTELNNDDKLKSAVSHECSCGEENTECKDPESCECNSSVDEKGMYITLTTDDGSDLKCQVLGTFDDGVEATYIALMPVGDDTVYLYGFEDDDDEPILRKIESDREYDRARTLFLELSE